MSSSDEDGSLGSRNGRGRSDREGNALSEEADPISETEYEDDGVGAASVAPTGVRTSMRTSQFRGNMQEPGIIKRASKPKSVGHQYHPRKPKTLTQRQGKRMRNHRSYANRSRAVTAAKLAVCAAARTKLDLALENFKCANKGWGDEVAADPTRLNVAFREHALLKRVQVVRAYIGYMMETKWFQRQLKQKIVAKEYDVHPKLVANWTSDFLN